MKEYWVYVIISRVKKYRYIGISDMPERRIFHHNSGYNKTTKPYIPFEQILLEKYKSRKDARDRERYLKSGSGREYLNQLHATP